MNLFLDAIAWIADPVNWSGPSGIPTRFAEQLYVTFVVLVIAAVIALPIGMVIGHTGKGRGFAVAVSGGLRALPTLGVLTLVGLWVGIGLTAPIISLVILAIPSLLAGAYSGFEAIDRRTVDAARSLGMTELQIVTKVELPLGLPLLIGGVRAATLQIVATATLAAYVADVGLGRYLFQGIKTQDYAEALGGSILVVILALVLDGLLALTQRLVVPAGVRAAAVQEVRTRPSRSRAVVGQPIEEGKK
ncbi:ABC transporter permease [Compostimonas suwonensis]|uniref:Osmoprotectant transport system permease protein n=1 Tax=Compostimonas suwonensis TaxID=1048394 RepID=A0A2M9BZ74_9MICO|nr:ABC transporter permease subunit [Compostimonas suwonensis]PJJ63389.1 osmoprotectant transport system permease protein [Compostimonas suwonensis]